MKVYFRTFLFVGLFCAFNVLNAQENGPAATGKLKPNPEKEAMYLPYLAVRHGGPASLQEWKKSNTVQYYKELWYYCESFYIKRDHLQQGVTMDASMIDISRFESSRKQAEEAIVVLPGFKDVLVLLPSNQLIYKPQ
ncbi:MAG: hypothetical protein JNL60_18770 [Bacteroidia bacterium]|nr:hypothetical protein [Bacteroidia bacterium]